MAKGELDFDDLHDFFERNYDVTSRSDGSWLFTSTSDRYDGWTVQFLGSGLTGTDIFPDAGTITRVIIKTPGGDVADDVDGLSLPATQLAAQFEFNDDEAGDDHGHGGDDDLAGDDGDDDLSGHGGDDHLDGENGDDHLHGNGGDDDLHGGAGDDKIVGNGGKDDLFGDEGNDHLKGQGNGDRLDGGADDDVLIGGGGQDVYVFARDFGDDVIKRFDHGKDKIDLSQINGLTFQQLAIERAHGDTIITIDKGTVTEATITIDKVTGGKTVDDSDFLFS